MPIPDLRVSSKADVAAHDEIVALSQKMMDLKQSDCSEESARKLDEQLDARIYSLFGLTPNEIAIVEDHSV